MASSSASTAAQRAGPLRRFLVRLGVLAPRFRRRSDALLTLLDLAFALGVCYLAFRLRFEGPLRDNFPDALMRNYRILTVLTCVLWVLAGRFSGLYRRSALRPGVSMLEPAFEAALSVGLIVLVTQYVLPHGGVSRAWVGLVVLGLVLAGIVSRGLVRRLRRVLAPLGIGHERYAAVGAGPPARRLVDDLTRAPGAPFSLVVTIDGTQAPAQVAQEALRLRLDGLVLPTDVDTNWAAKLAAALSGTGVDVLLAPRPGELQLRVASIATLQGVPLLRVAGLSPRRRAVHTPADRTRPLRIEAAFSPRVIVRRRKLAKLVVDRIIAGLVLIAAIPLLLIVALAIKLDSGGPLFFRQVRVGRGGRLFKMWKFRSMVVDAEALHPGATAADESGVLFKARQDPRVTRVGRVLRRVSLDELPQLFNVLGGNMSLVGPRPALPAEVAQYPPEMYRRLSVRPGITGLWQVSGRSDLTWEDAIRLDTYYVDHRSFWLDVKIVLRTPAAVLGRRGAY